MKIIYLLSILILCFAFDIHAQNENTIVEDSLFDISTTKARWDMSFAFKTQNVFRGLLPSAAPTFSTQAGVIWKDWILGMYGGVGTDGVYQETDFILVYYKPRINVHLEYYYNFTQGITDIPDPSGLFDFNKRTTRGLLDLIFHIRLDKKSHWGFTSATFLFGRDTDIEEVIEDGESTTKRTNQRYSQYFEINYSWYWDNGKVEAYLGGSFSWANPSGEQFYGKHAGFNNIGISFTRKFVINDQIHIPIKASSHINAIDEISYLILTVNLIQVSKI